MLASLARIEQNQTRALEMQAHQLTLLREQMEHSRAKVAESLALQQLAVARQARALRFLMPVIGVLVMVALYLMARS